MRKIFLMAAIALVSVSAAVAKPKFKSIDIYGKSTTIVVEDKNAGDSLRVTSAVFYNNGEALSANSIKANLNNGVAKITMKFRRCTVFNNCYVVININGNDQCIDLKLGGIIKGIIK